MTPQASTKLMWEPLRESVFRALWIAAIVSNIGSFMQDVGSAWLMTSLTPSPIIVALMQTAAFLPFFLLSLPAGALADVFDRRTLLIMSHIWMLAAAFALGLLTIFGLTTPWLLITLTFVLSIGGTIGSPAWSAVIPELVPKKEMGQAIALSSMGYNMARGLGSAIGGVCVAAMGPGAVFLINAISFISVVLVLVNWKRETREPVAQSERIAGAMKAGLRFARHSPTLKNVFIRATIFASCASCLWALLPLIARQKLGLDCTQYGLLLSMFGAGTMLGAYLLPMARRTKSIDKVSMVGQLCFVASLAILALAPNFIVACLSMIPGGISWIFVNTCLNVGAQLSSPTWVKARSLALYILVYQGSLAFGSAAWGYVASLYGLTWPLWAAAIGLAVGVIAIHKYRLKDVEHIDTTLSDHWTDPRITLEPHPDHGPVMVTTEYMIDPDRAAEFALAMRDLSTQRRRDGAYQWHLFQDLAQPGRFVETFLVESWAEHLRQHERVTVADKNAEERVASFHIGDKPPVVAHMISAYADQDVLANTKKIS